MQKIILINTYVLILLTILNYNLFAANHYVDNAANGLNNGTSWTNAWESFAAINWASISPGDFIYISGGSTSKTYNETLTPQCIGNVVNRITIIPGKYSPFPSGHNGTVIINGGVYLNEYASTTPKYITIKGFEITGGNVDFNADVAWMKGITIDSNYIHDYGSDFGVKMIKYVDSAIVQNNIIIDCLAGDCAGDRDGIHVNEDAGVVPKNIIIRYNWVRVTSQDPNAHNDAFQSVSGDGFYVYNNVFINDSVNSPEGGGMPMILSAVDDDNNDSPPVLIFNNFCYMGGIWMSGANQGWVYELRHDAGTTWPEILPTYVFGNTLVSNGPRNRVFGNGEAYCNLAINNIWASYCLPDGGYPNNWRTGTTIPITDATNTNPIVITTAFDHTIQTGVTVTIVGCTGNTAANGTRTATRINATQFSLNGSNGNGTYTGNGSITGDSHGWMEALGLGPVYTTHYMYQDSIRNNVFWRQDSSYLQVGTQSAMIVGGGYIYGIGGTGGFNADDCWDDWVAKGGTGLFRNPRFVTPFGHVSNQGTILPDIESNSPAIDAGEDYTYLVNYLHITYPVIPQDVLDAIPLDFYGNERGADGYWDIGAVEYQSNSQAKVNGVIGPAKVNGTTSPKKINGVIF